MTTYLDPRNLDEAMREIRSSRKQIASLRAEVAALKLDAARLEWLLPVVTGVSDEVADNRALGLARQLVNGFDNRQAIDKAMRGVK